MQDRGSRFESGKELQPCQKITRDVFYWFASFMRIKVLDRVEICIGARIFSRILRLHGLMIRILDIDY